MKRELLNELIKKFNLTGVFDQLFQLNASDITKLLELNTEEEVYEELPKIIKAKTKGKQIKKRNLTYYMDI